MKTRSAKAKGRRAAQEAREMILRWFPDLEPGDIAVTSSGCTGEDLVFSPKARRALPISVECKCVEKLNVWEALEQAKSHVEKKPGVIPTLIFRRNRSELHIALRLEDFLRFVGVVETQTSCITGLAAPLLQKLAEDGRLIDSINWDAVKAKVDSIENRSTITREESTDRQDTSCDTE